MDGGCDEGGVRVVMWGCLARYSYTPPHPVPHATARSTRYRGYDKGYEGRGYYLRAQQDHPRHPRGAKNTCKWKMNQPHAEKISVLTLPHPPYTFFLHTLHPFFTHPTPSVHAKSTNRNTYRALFLFVKNFRMLSFCKVFVNHLISLDKTCIFEPYGVI